MDDPASLPVSQRVGEEADLSETSKWLHVQWF
jgi:hypothetical protein